DTSGLIDESDDRNICIDLTNPFVSLVFPFNDSSFTFGVLNLSFVVEDNLDSSLTCNITLDDLNIYENVDYQNGTVVNVSSGGLSDGIHYWNVSCVDESGRGDVSEMWQFNISDTPPTVSLLSPEDSSVVLGSEVNFTFLPDDNSGISICELLIDGVYEGNITNPLLGVNNSIFVGSISEGVHDWGVSCTDLSESIVDSGNWTISIDVGGPVIDIFAPEDNFISSTATPDFDVNITDAVDSSLDCDLYVEGSVFDSFSAISGNRFNFTLSSSLDDGVSSWYLNCTDDVYHSNVSASRNIDIREAPVVILNDLNDSHVSSSGFSVTYTPTDNADVNSCSLYIDGILNYTDNSISMGSQNLIEVGGFSNGVYDYYVNCSDSHGNAGISEEFVRTIDSEVPILFAYYPLNENVYAENITFNFSAQDAYSDELNCTIFVDGSPEDANIIFNNGANVSRVVSGPEDGYHLWNFTCWDLAGNSNSSLTYNFTRLTSPGIDLVSPLNGTWLNYSDVSLVYFAQDDQGIDKAELFLNGVFEAENNSVISGVNNEFSETFSDGFYNWSVRVTDVSMMTQMSSVWEFYVDTESPEIALNYPSEISNVTENTVEFNFNVSDNLDSAPFCNLSLDGEVEFSGAVLAGENNVALDIWDGFYNWSVLCWDAAGNVDESEVVNFAVFAPPQIDLVNPVDAFITTESDLVFEYRPIDGIGIFNCSIYLDEILNKSDNGVVINSVNNFTIEGIDEDVHNWSVECVDFDGNVNRSEYREFVRDVVGPSITLEEPLNDSGVYYDGSVLFTWSAKDNYDNFMQCNLSVDGVVEESGVWVTGGVSNSESVNGLTQGKHSWDVDCWDSVGNSNVSLTYNFNLTYPDFFVNESLIFFNVSIFHEGENVLVNASVENIGGADVEDVVVRFYEGAPNSSGQQIGNDIVVDIDGHSSSFVNATVNLGIGNTEIYVVVDEPLLYNEWNEENNYASKSLNVGSWQFFYGDISSSEYSLMDSNSSQILKWNADNFEDGSIFISDSESIISWPSLVAVGEKANGGSAFEDFSEIDFILNMTGFSDSVHKIYTEGGSVRNVSDYFVFGKEINDVAVVESINSSNFVTGILWDSNDDTDGNYSVFDKEDLVFVSKIRKNTLGTYGVVDYELRVPAKLREYGGVDSSSAVFYVELF
ncbi:MAG: hypothetical protein OQK82_05040, partial [Candidatus Pacearchaeota archaeon]|nr:hypothetical protein [Candidatus Pacearchaeota archaeon]